MIQNNRARRSLRVANFAACVSFAALATAFSQQALAQCSPDPTQASTPTICSGTDTNGISITTSSSPLTVASGATLSNSNAPAIYVSIPAIANSTQRSATVVINGSVSATGAAGILLSPGAPYGSNYDFSGLNATITIGRDGSLSGTTAIARQSNNNPYSTYAGINVALDNAGSITGTNGPALSNVTNAGFGGGYSTITNRATGTIGAISAGFNVIKNDGVIDGGSLSAVNTASGFSSGQITNTGTIRSANSVATIDISQLTLTNSGTISNSGGGSAIGLGSGIGSGSLVSATNNATGLITANGATTIAATSNLGLNNAGTITNSGTGGTTISGGYVTISNAAGAVISAPSGGNAIVATTSLSLTNAGTINGNVLAGSTTWNSSVDSTAGTINGNVLLGSGNDTLVANYSNGTLATGITGTVDGGAGSNTLKVNFASDTTLSSALPLPTNFNLLALSLGQNTLTLASGFTAPGTITVDGTGSLINQASLTGASQALNVTGSLASLTNSGSITTTASGNYALSTSGGSFTNSGTITAAGNGVYTWTSLTNSGTIAAAGIGLNQTTGNFNNSGTISGNTYGVQYSGYGYSFLNSGTISSGSGTGLVFSGNSYNSPSRPLNSGTITGTIGLNLMSTSFNNSGTISGNTGATLSSGAVLSNLAGGTIAGSTLAITSNGAGASVVNAGTINGNVNLASNPQQYARSIYVARSGGVLNGNLTLGTGDTLVTALGGASTSGYAGINGTVLASGSILRYDVGADGSDTLNVRSGFSQLGYQLANGANLSLSASGTYGQSLTLAGTGTVNNAANITTTDASAVMVSSVIQPDSSNLPANALTLFNSGTLTMNRVSSNAASAAVALDSATSFTNSGTIALNDTSNGTYISAAVTGGGSITNSGTIGATGGYAINAGQNYNGAVTISNSGTITSNLATIALNYGTAISNSGTIISTTGAAIADANGSGSYASITNLASGAITGQGTAIQMPGGLVSNAGTINGDVNLGYSYYGQQYGNASSNVGAYVANGGTLNGNLTFGNGDDILVETGSGYGVTGTINGGAGNNWVEHRRSGTATATLGGTLPTNFTSEAVVANTTISQITLTGPAAYTSSIYVGGNGTIINQLATSGSVSTYSSYPFTSGLPSGNYAYLTRFSNRANIGALSLSANALDNTATIGSASLTNSAVTLYGNAGISFANSGTIINNGLSPAVTISTSSATASNSTITNSGTITGGLSVASSGASDSTLSITNSGAITSFSQSYYVYTPYQPPYYSIATNDYAVLASSNGKSLSLTNSGTITGNIALSGPGVSLVNNGTIIGNITTGSGNDSFTMNGAFAGSLNGGTGTNTLSITGGSPSAPVAFSAISNIASLTQSGGYATLIGTATLGSVTMSGGRLVGLAGSVFNAASFTVGAGATFGSAGTVNGNIAVAGTLSPGASPGTMTVNGNVALSSGSTSLFEITPTVSDKLNINGSLSIAPGSTLQIATSTPIKVGTTLDLITASKGITGSFDNVTGITGAVKPLANGDLGLLVQFATPSGFNPQLQRTIAYINNAMAANGAPAALIPALSALQDANAAPIASAFARLTPEPYADAMQIGAENAITLAATTRMLGEGETHGPAHLFAFGQMMGSLRQFDSNEAQGISRATLNGYGVLGGLGVAGENFALSAYVGWMDQSQTIAALGASTQSRGVIGGMAARLERGATRLTLSASYDAARATTQRSVPDAGSIKGSYGLPSWSYDASISHAKPLAKNWLIRPYLGTTWVSTRHDALAEASPHPFAMNVAGASMKQGFVDAGLGFETAPDAKSPWRSFLTLGARYRAYGKQSQATAALAGYSTSLVAEGVTRNQFDATVAAGMEYLLPAGVTLFLNTSGEFGKASNRGSLVGGVRFRF